MMNADQLQTARPFNIYDADALLELWRGRRARCTELERLAGATLGPVYRLHLGASPFDVVLKIGRLGDPALALQAAAHRFVRQTGGFPCPEVYHVDCSGSAVPYAFLLLEYVPGSTLDALGLPADRKILIERELAGILLKLHANTRETYGPIDGSGATTRWSDIVFARMTDMRREMERHLPQDVLPLIDAAVKAVPAVFADQGAPTLVHGDLWSGNIIVSEAPDGWHITGIVDVGAEYADVEQELAYLEGFGTAGAEFFGVYCASRPLRPGYDLRRLFYHLNTQMVHVWHFGDQCYKDMAAALARQIAARL